MISTDFPSSSLACLVLAAGKGTRMKSDHPKVMHEIAGRPMISWLMEQVTALLPEKLVVVVGQDMPELEKTVSPTAQIAVQTLQRGTGDAVRAGLPVLGESLGDVLILLGDTPLIRAETLRALIAARHATGAGLSVLGIRREDPSGFGRLVMSENERVLSRIVEELDATEDEKNIKLCNSGIFCVDGAYLARWLEALTPANAQGEFYITDLPALAARDGVVCTAHLVEMRDEFLSVNTRAHLANLERAAQNHLRSAALEGGATLTDPESVFLSWDTRIGKDVCIGPHVVFGQDVIVEDGAEILPFCHIAGARIRRGASVGPFARIRPHTDIGEEAKIGNFVEVKNVHVGKGSKASHLTYLGDAEIGAGCNIGAGTIFCNYDGRDKHKTVLGSGAFIGSNSTLVAPLTVGDGAYVAAGSVMTRDVPEDALAVARSRPILRDGWARARRESGAAHKEKTHKSVD